MRSQRLAYFDKLLVLSIFDVHSALDDDKSDCARRQTSSKPFYDTKVVSFRVYFENIDCLKPKLTDD